LKKDRKKGGQRKEKKNQRGTEKSSKSEVLRRVPSWTWSEEREDPQKKSGGKIENPRNNRANAELGKKSRDGIS